MIPEKIRKIIGFILIGIGILLSLIAIALWIVAGGTGILSIISVILAFLIVMIFLFGFVLISYGSEWGSRNVSLLD
tara:strand:- start:20 stop:247 length:228 start_codon:yes stop_codon:yes gene_type:complete